VDDGLWRQINRPHGALSMDVVLEGMLRFAEEYVGELVTETMLVRGVNDTETSVVAVAEFLKRLGPRVAYLAVPTRPPAELWVRSPSEEIVNRAFQILSARLPRVELLAEFEGVDFGSTGDPAKDLIAITAVHPIREDAALALLARAGADRAILDRLVTEDRLRPVQYLGQTFYTLRGAGPPLG